MCKPTASFIYQKHLILFCGSTFPHCFFWRQSSVTFISFNVQVPVLSVQILMSYPSVSQSEIPSQCMINYHVFHRISQSCLPARGWPFAIAKTTIMTSSDNSNKCIEICWCCPSLNTSTLMSPLFGENFSNCLDCLKL